MENEKINPFKIKGQEEPEEKEYLLLLYLVDDDGEEIRTFEYVTGREATYNYIKDLIDEIDINKSLVIVPTVTINDSLNIHRFMKLMEKYFPDSDFDIDEYDV